LVITAPRYDLLKSVIPIITSRDQLALQAHLRCS
jgi:hypothetical protein